VIVKGGGKSKAMKNEKLERGVEKVEILTRPFLLLLPLPKFSIT
jgi:hypothetical protein